MGKEIQKFEDLEGVKLCATCEAFIPGCGSHVWEDARRDSGDCIRNPPIPAIGPTGTSRAFPVVSGIDRCMKWKDAKRKFLTTAYAETLEDLAF